MLREFLIDLASDGRRKLGLIVYLLAQTVS